MTTTPRVRAARHDDIEVLVEFNTAMALETEAKQLDPDILRAGIARMLAEPNRGFYLVAEIGGEVAGCVMVTFEWSDWRNGEWWWLQSVYVRPEHRRHGVFRTLFAEVEQRAGQSADAVGLRLYVERDNRHAQRTYTSLGMREDHYRIFDKPLRGDVRDALRQHG